MKINKEKITVLFGSWVHLCRDGHLYDVIEDSLDIYFDDIDYVDDIFRGLQPGDRLEIILKYLENINKDNKDKVLITSNPDFIDIVKGFCDYNKIPYKFVFFKVIEKEPLIESYDLELEDLGQGISKIFKEANKEWSLASEKFYPNDKTQEEN